MPALLLDSTGSPGWMRQVSRTVAGTLADARHRSLEGGFHHIPEEVPGPVLESFFSA
jgi:hypothetical protein